MVALISFIVLATAGLSTVSAASVSKRDLTADAASIGSALDQLDTDVNNLNLADPTGTTAAITLDLNALVSTISSAAIAEEGQSELGEELPPALMNLFGQFEKTISDIESSVSIIQTIPNLTEIVASGMAQAETATGAYLNAVLAILPKDLQTGVLVEQRQILGAFETAQDLLNASPSS